MKKLLNAGIAGLLALSMFLVGCGSSTYKSADMIQNETSPAMDGGFSYNGITEENGYFGEENTEVAEDWAVDGSDFKQNDSGNDFVREADSNEKLIYTCFIDMETLEYQKTISTLKELIKKYDGFIESESESDDAYNWYYSDYRKTSGTLTENIVVRIPVGNYNDFLSDIEGSGKVINKRQNAQNITKEYNNTAITIKSLETQETRLLEMMENATTIEDMIYIENRLSEVQNELAMYKNDLNEMDNDVAYSTITLNISEVLEYSKNVEPEKTTTFGDRLKNQLKHTWKGFLTFLENFLFFIIDVTPVLLFLGATGGIIALFVVKLVRHSRNKRVSKKARTAPPKKEDLKENRSNNVADTDKK